MVKRRPPVRNPRNKKGEFATCRVCGRPVIGPAVYCSDACKQKAYRERIRIRKERTK